MISILIRINYIVSNFPIAVNHFILDTNGFYLITQMQHNTLWCVCWFFSPLSLSPDQLSGTPPGPSCYWQYSAVSQALFWVSVLSPTDPRTGESAPVASPWFCQVTVKTQGNPEDQRERERESVSLWIWCSGVFLSNISHQCSHLISGFLALLALAIYTGVTVTFFGKRFTSWRFSWSYIIGWVAIILAFTAGLFRVLFVWTSQPVINKDKDDDSFIVISSPVT